jgi:hypothetical protein
VRSVELVEPETRLQAPEQFQPVNGPHVWYASEYQEPLSYAYKLTEQDIAELEAAQQQVSTSGKELKDVTQADFHLPTFGPKLLRFRDECINGRGFVLLQGLPVERWSVQETAVAYWGIGTYWGTAQSQNRLHHLLGHVKDLSPPGGLDNPENRIYATHAAQPYHTDSSDLVALLCLRPAKEGGYSTWASSYTVYNEMLKRRPDLVEVLAQPFYVDRKGEIPEGSLPYFQLPIFNFYKGKLIVYYENHFFRSASRHEGVPELTAKQVEALDYFAALADSNELRMDYILQPGDIQLLHNHSIVHARTAYVDHDEETVDKKRHLMRLWLSPENDWDLPEAFGARWEGVQQGKRGGIYVPGSTPRAPLDAEAYW